MFDTSSFFYNHQNWILFTYSALTQHLGHLKPLISTSNLYQNANPVTVLNSACSEDSKTPPTCWNWSSFDRVIWCHRQMIPFSKIPVDWSN